MTKKELIKALEKYSDDTKILICAEDIQGFGNLTDIVEILDSDLYSDEDEELYNSIALKGEFGYYFE